ncbi:MAG: hypothetical protein JST59_10130 [Actinobacteria bacterium]|nr:hypothetical protein [Actinomycetota bacterium]
MSHPTASPRALVLAAALFLCTALLIAAPSGARAASTANRLPQGISARPTVPVLAEAGGASLGERLRGAKVRVYAISQTKRGQSRRRLVGRGRTGRLGVDILFVKGHRRPRNLLVVVSGGKLLGKPFGGHMKALVTGGQPAYVSPLSSLVVAYRADHPHVTLQRARRAVRGYYRIPGFFDFAGDLADRHLFDGSNFVRRARSHGGFDRYVVRRAKHLNRNGANSSAVEGTASGACWQEAAETTAGFAELMGFTGVPNPPALDSCPGGGSANGSSAHASGLLKSVANLEVFGAVVGVASLIYGIVSGQSSGSELHAIREQLNEVQAELVAIQADLGGLQRQVTAVNQNVINGDITDLSGDAAETITDIKYANSKTMILLGQATQILCEGRPNCATPAGTKELGEALGIACEAPESATCKAFYSELYVTAVRLEEDRPLKGVEDLGRWSLGSAFTRGPAEPGIVQYSLEEGGNGKPFFTTADAASARLQWAYYTLYSVLDQSTYATVLGMSVGQPLPGSTSKHPPELTVENVKQFVNELNKPISTMIAAFPNMPDSAVVVTNETTENGDPPYVIAQQVGADAGLAEYNNNKRYELTPAAVAAGQIPPNGGGSSLITYQKSGAAPIVLTPAAEDGENWRILPNPGERRAPLPKISSAPFLNWRLSWSEATNELPQWNSSTQKVERAQGGLKGPLPDLFAAYQESGSRTAGQWMTAESGIESALLTPLGTGYETSAGSGVVAYFAKSGTDSSDPGLGFTYCVPSGDTECLLPTWQSPSIDPYAQTSESSNYNAGSKQINTGLFDFNNGLVFDNQQGHVKNPERGFNEALESNKSAFVNQYPNWGVATSIRGVNFFGFLEALNGQASGTLGGSAYAGGHGRPVLFVREQEANDCFYWTGSNSGAANGAGCLAPRTKSGEILP